MADFHHGEITRRKVSPPNRLQTWRGKPLISRQTVVELIASTTTKAGLTVRCELDTGSYPKGIQVSKEEMASLNITGDAFHPEWNYTVSPRVPP